MKIVFINRYFHPDHSATSQLLTDLAVDLADRGHEVAVVCSRQLYEDQGAQLPHRASHQGVEIHRAWSTTFGRGTLPGRLLDYLSFYAGAWAVLKQLCGPQVLVVAKTDPPLVSVLAAQAVRRKGGILVNWLQDLFPEVGALLGVRLLQGRLGRWLERVRDASLRTARTNVAIGERMAQRLVQRGIPANQLEVIANWSDDQTVCPIAKSENPLIAEWDLQDKFVVMYSGNLGRAHEYTTLLNAAELLQSDPRFVFLMVGGGAKYASMREEAAARGIQNLQFRPYQPRSRLAASLGVGDVHLISLLPEMEGLIVPSKFYGILAAGRPCIFIGDPDGELARIIDRFGIGQHVAVGEALKLAQSIQACANGSHHTQGMQARQLLLERFEKSVALARWEAVLKSASTGQLTSAVH